MGAAIKVTRMDHSAAELRVLAEKSDAGKSRRLLAIAIIQEGTHGLMLRARRATDALSSGTNPRVL